MSAAPTTVYTLTPSTRSTAEDLIDDSNDTLIRQQFQSEMGPGEDAVISARVICGLHALNYSYDDLLNAAQGDGVPAGEAMQFVNTATLVYCNQYESRLRYRG